MTKKSSVKTYTCTSCVAMLVKEAKKKSLLLNQYSSLLRLTEDVLVAAPSVL